MLVKSQPAAVANFLPPVITRQMSSATCEIRDAMLSARRLTIGDSRRLDWTYTVRWYEDAPLHVPFTVPTHENQAVQSGVAAAAATAATAAAATAAAAAAAVTAEAAAAAASPSSPPRSSAVTSKARRAEASSDDHSTFDIPDLSSSSSTKLSASLTPAYRLCAIIIEPHDTHHFTRRSEEGVYPAHETMQRCLELLLKATG